RLEAEADVLVGDTAHGHSRNVLETLRWIKSRASIEVIAGNVAPEEGARALIDAGAAFVDAQDLGEQRPRHPIILDGESCRNLLVNERFLTRMPPSLRVRTVHPAPRP
ncbi:MAG: IMP dehydrogenase, partial [Phycisphaerales bacterium]